ncbi:hypothetical protein QBC34DRAFT_419559 [Podospora aff. communis PSN243]|uniref:Uncharacterized protein n=1 Tax=Podospora aff. communis PSN243 TaxID=3040156 RepID=A0AAV9FYY6_9PEZI|nr:hypothetical protein QBC34DRAFT_419559 [Podospora aff. communis PSN243]
MGDMTVFQALFCTQRSELQAFCGGVLVSAVGLGAIEFVIAPVLLILFCNRHFPWLSWLAFWGYFVALTGALNKWTEHQSQITSQPGWAVYIPV